MESARTPFCDRVRGESMEGLPRSIGISVERKTPVPPVSVLFCALFAACAADAGRMALPGLADAGGGETGDEVENWKPFKTDSGPEPLPLTVTAVAPASGPFSGGNLAVVRGSGFTGETSIIWGENEIESQQITLVDSHRLSVLVPAGEPGRVDVTVEQEGESETLDDGYSYNALVVNPDSGSTAGGSLVEVTGSGTAFATGVQVSFGDKPCEVQEVVSPTLLFCATPSMEAGPVEVSVSSPDGTQLLLSSPGAYTFVDPADTGSGGLGGGPISGTLNVTVVDSNLGMRLPGVFVVLGEDPATHYRGLTDKMGQVTFSGLELQGPLTVHAALRCYEKGSIVLFDATDATLFLRSNIGIDPDCMELPRSIEQFEMDSGQSSSGHGQAGAYVTGELIFPGFDEFMYNDWETIPRPRDNEIRVAYVYATRVNPSASDLSGGTANRIVEAVTPLGSTGYPYRILVRPSALAIYALAGLENRDSGEFIPYLMGVKRGLIAAPNQETPEADVFVDIPLDRELTVLLGNLPERTASGPDRFAVRAVIDLGGEGVIVREVRGDALDLLESSNGGSPFRFFAQPSFTGNLAGARYQVSVSWHTGFEGVAPYTATYRTGMAQPEGPVLFDDLLGIPQAVSPPAGGEIPADRVLRWKADGEQPDLHIVTLTGDDGVRAWRQIVPGSLRQTPIPDLSQIAELQDIRPGALSWGVYAVKIPAFSYDEFLYDYLSDRYWSHEAHNSFTLRR